MKRYGNLFFQVCSFLALATAAVEAAKGKRDKPRVAEFLRNLENEVLELEGELNNRSYRPRSYTTFMIHDPKQRRICAADFRDRVVHHALCRVLEPIFERSLIFDSYACRQGKGTHAAVRRARMYCRKFGYFLKLDVHKFFDTINHDILKSQLRRKVKDRELLWLLDVFIDHPVPWTEPGRGLPIGNLTSQHFANFYLSSMDHYIKEVLGIKGYVRYMDDLLLFADEKYVLRDAGLRIEEYLNSKLSLRIKQGSMLLAPVCQGLPFLGLRIFPGVVRLSRQGWRRFRRKMMWQEFLFSAGIQDEDGLIRSLMSMVGHIRHANTRNLRKSFFGRPGAEEALTG